MAGSSRIHCHVVYIITTSRATLLLLILLLIFLLSTSTRAEYAELCETEQLRAQCDHGQVIVMETARYGRMRLGRCVKTNLGFLGCQADVLHVLDRRCSGRRTCQVSVPDPELDKVSQCLEELKTYLELTYHCVTVDDVSSTCDLPTPQPGSNVFISRATSAMGLTCGTLTQPWRLTGRAGQKIRLTLIDFNSGTSAVLTAGGLGPSQRCREYGTVIEPDASRKMPICGGSGRVLPIVTTRSHTAQVVLHKTADDALNFIIRYELVGCVDYVAPPPLTSQRLSVTDTLVSCYSGSPVTWSLSCVNETWTGTPANCTTTSASEHGRGVSNEEPLASYNDSLASFVMSAFVILMLALLTSITIFIVGFVIHRRRRKFRQAVMRQAIYERSADMMGGDMMGSSSSTKTLRCQACSTENILMMPALRCASIHHQHQQQPPSYSHPLQHSSCEDAVTSSDNVVVDDDALEDCRYDHRLQQQMQQDDRVPLRTPSHFPDFVPAAAGEQQQQQQKDLDIHLVSSPTSMSGFRINQQHVAPVGDGGYVIPVGYQHHHNQLRHPSAANSSDIYAPGSINRILVSNAGLLGESPYGSSRMARLCMTPSGNNGNTGGGGTLKTFHGRKVALPKTS